MNVAPANDAVPRYVGLHLFTIDLELAEPFEDLRTGIERPSVPVAIVIAPLVTAVVAVAALALAATAEEAIGTKVTSLVRVVRPPDGGFIAAHIELEKDSRLRKPLVQPQHPAVDLGVGTIKDDFAMLAASPFLRSQSRLGIDLEGP